MSKWAGDKEVVDIEELTKPIVEAIQSAIELDSNTDAEKVGVVWNGPRLMSKWLRATIPQPEVQLQPEQLKYHAERGRSVFDVIAGIAIQLGIEQGMRIYEENYLEQEILSRRIDKRLEEK